MTSSRISGRVTLFRVREKSVGSLNDPYAIWWRVAAGGVDLREISGDHLSLLKEPQVRLLAEELSDCWRICWRRFTGAAVIAFVIGSNDGIKNEFIRYRTGAGSKLARGARRSPSP